jgi:hypothetical protein
VAALAQLPGYETMEEDEVLQMVKQWFESLESGDWVLILDNSDNKLDFFPEYSSQRRYVSGCFDRLVDLHPTGEERNRRYNDKGSGSCQQTGRLKCHTKNIYGCSGGRSAISQELPERREIHRARQPKPPRAIE